MTRYFFHVRSREDLLVDEEGLEKTLEEALQLCRVFACDLMSADVRAGFLDLSQSIVLADADGRVIAEMPFSSAITFQPMAASARPPEMPKLAIDLLIDDECGTSSGTASCVTS